MGNYFSKNTMNSDSFESPKKFYDEMSTVFDSDEDFLENIDPRSPNSNINRTPISEIIKSLRNDINISKQCDLSTDLETPDRKLAPNSVYNKKLLKTLGYDLNDPRSPSQMINRTPLNFLKQSNDQLIIREVSIPSVEFNETEINEQASFEDALDSMCEEFRKSFSESPLKKYEKPYLETSFDKGETSQTIQPVTPSISQDPRSPSIGIERTPLVFNEDNNKDEIVDVEINEMVNEIISDIKKYTKKMKNEKLENVYEEETHVKYTTPKKPNVLGDTNTNFVRTPLGCIANKTNKSKNLVTKQLHKNISNNIKNFNDENTPTKTIVSAAAVTRSKNRFQSTNRIVNNIK